MMGVSISSAELSKKEMTVLSAVKKIETCSTLTPRFFVTRVECFSMKVILSSFGPPWYRCNVLTGKNFVPPPSAMAPGGKLRKLSSLRSLSPEEAPGFKGAV
jgi:hypothetical protein